MRGIYPLPQESVVKQSPTAEDPMADATQNKEGSQVSGVFLPTDPSPYDNNMSNSNGVQQSYELVQQTFHPVPFPVIAVGTIMPMHKVRT